MNETNFQNTLYTQDNLFVLYGMNSEMVDLIYLDPPFNSKRMYSAPVGSKAAGSSFKDMWTWDDVNLYYLDVLAEKYPTMKSYVENIGLIHSKAMSAYLTYMAQRIVEMHRILKPTGSLYLHCDPTANHYLKSMLDMIFGPNNFRNEIVWHYSGWNAKLKESLNKRYDTILFYSKNDNSTFNGYSEKWQSEAEYIKIRKQKVLKDANNRKYVMSDAGGGSRIKRYLDEALEYGKPACDVWVFDKLNNSSKERTGYPTQKPLELLNRIITMSSNEGDIVFDPFCGCATACVAAQQLGRKWIGIDIAEQSARILVNRLSDDAGLFKDFIATTLIPKRTDVEIIEPTISVKERLYKEQNGKCNLCQEDFLIRNLEIDHIIPKSKNGGDYYENYQLLCGFCNKLKGTNPMAAARKKFDVQEQLLKTKIKFGE